MGQGSVLITGAGSGLGRRLAVRFGGLGARVALLGRRPEPLEATQRALPEACPDSLVLPTDVRVPDGVRAAVGAVEERWGSLQLVVNNAALLANSPQQVPPWMAFECVLKTNVLGPALVAEEAVRILPRGGVVVNVSSSAAREPTPDALAYGASKAALDHLTRSLAVRYAPRGVRVVGVAPGGRGPRERGVSLDEATVEMVVFLASRFGARLNATTLLVDDGQSVRNLRGRR